MQTKSKVSAAVGTAVAAGIIAIALVVGDGSNAHRSEHSAHPTALPVPSDLASSYRFLTSASSTRRPAGLLRGVSGVPGGSVVLSPGREAGAIGRERLWLVRGKSKSCLEIDDRGSACGPTSLIARQGVWLMLVPVTGAAPTVYGIVPDGATVTGRAAKVTQSGNVYMVRPTSRRPGRFTVHTKRGATVATSIPPATGHPQQP